MPRPTVSSSLAGHRTPAATTAKAGLGSNPSSSSSAAAAESSMASLIERATSTTAPAVDPALLRAIKSSARASDGAIRDAFRLLLSLMSKPHSHVRLLAFSIADELFMRSKLFRSLLADALDGFLPLAVGFRRAHPLPPPTASAALLRKAAVQALERWHHLFGAHYRQLRLAVEYLKVSARVQFPGLRATVEARAAREARTQEILAAKVEQLRGNLASIKAEIRTTMDEIRNGSEIIRAEYEKFEGYVNDDDDAEQEIASLSMRSIRMASLMAGEWVPETQENEAVFDALREAYRLLVSKHLVTVKEWICVLIRVNLPDNRFRDSALKEFIDVKNEIRAVRDWCSELGLNLDNVHRSKDDQEEEDDEFWVEGNIEAPSPAGVQSSVDVASTSRDTGKGKRVVGGVKSDIGKAQVDGNGTRNLDPEKSELFAEAPVVPWSSVLDRWGSSGDAHVNQRGLELESHWGRVDNDAVIPAAKIAELNVHSSVYREAPVEILPCHAPLKKGGLCQRRDLKVCPFHGPIVPRDAEGNPIEQHSSSSGTEVDPVEHCDIRGNSNELNGNSDVDYMEEASSSRMTDTSNDYDNTVGTDDLGKITVEKLARQAIKNVRKRDMDHKARERAQRLRIRQHNEDVLRDAAIASTSHSAAAYEQPPEAWGRRGRRGRTKAPTLASMLKKKVTTKDRIAERLLNTRATDATIREASHNEDMSYREAFPNQW
ncbi:UV-stimulated scaffold protein A-like protein [Dichanthelium oligosanthes]|uniref:UV-stimulated scaffold protein A-like protein n=1 Tax=Dichanthelium oligosanthes TaxID=888268 RepID=A0A1E5WAG7_9POAL|nr:UV-stimulated scaffold protein A-like protein [Dichanthelium oligosanthes]